MKSLSKWLSATLVLAAFMASSSVYATNGYFTHGIGTKNKAMAGSGIALPEDAIDIANNPAVAALVGDNMQLGAALFNPIRKYETTASQLNGQLGSFTIGPNSLSSESKFFVIPHIARTWQFNNGHAFGFAFYGRGGMNTDWKGGTATFDPDGPGPAPIMTLDGTYGAGNAGVDLSQAFLDLTWGKAVSDRFAIGLSAVIVGQVFEADGVRSFAGFTETFVASGGQTFPANLSNNGHVWSYGLGYKIGFHSNLTDRFSVGLSYQGKINMTEFDRYADLFAEQGDFDIPPAIKFGMTFKATEQFAINFDIEHMWYSEVDAVGNPISNLFGCPSLNPMSMDFSSCLGGDNGAGFGWEDMTVYKVGAAWTTGNKWTWRAGFSYGEQPIPESELTFNILAPATPETHLTFGFTKETQSGNEWNFSLMYAPNNKVRGLNTFDPTQQITIEMYQLEAEVSYGWRF
jgi:long-chain fatty acid transport protein